MRRLPLISYLIIAYMLLAFGWWSVLLLRKNRESHEARVDKLAIELALQRKINRPEDFYRTDNYLRLQNRFEGQQWMIVGEAALLILSLAGGLYLLYRNLRREISAAEQQRNFLLSITHELKSPLAGIRLILETFQRRKELPEPIQQRLSTNGLAETDRLTTLVNDLLLSAKLEDSYLLNREPLDLGSLVREAADRVAIKYREAKLNLSIDDDLPPVEGDRLGMLSVAINLVENAVKYSAPNPEINITVRRAGQSEIEWTVADNGIGIPDREKRRVWTKFYRVGSEDTRTTKGTGLGLFIVKQLIDRHGGQVAIHDNQPRGSVFTVHLPATQTK